jgi:phage terminase Nu1 subunit (DNA packaging protein)
MSRRDLSSLDKERIRLTKAQSEYEELKVVQARAKQIPSDVVVMAWQAKTANARTACSR